MIFSRTFQDPITRRDGITFPSRIEIDSPIHAQDLLHLQRDETKVILSVSQVEMNLSIVRATLTLTPALARHAAKILNALADDAERAGA